MKGVSSETKNLGRVVMWQMLTALKEGDFGQAMDLAAPGHWKLSREALRGKTGLPAWEAIVEPEVIICFSSAILQGCGILLVCREAFKRVFRDPRSLPPHQVMLICSAFKEASWPHTSSEPEELELLLRATAELMAELDEFCSGAPTTTEEAVARMRAAAVTSFLGLIGMGEALDKRTQAAGTQIAEYFANLKMAHAAGLGSWDKEGVRANPETDVAMCDVLRAIIKPSVFEALNPDGMLKGMGVGQA